MQVWIAVGLQLLILVVGISGFAFLMKGSLEEMRTNVNKLDRSVAGLNTTVGKLGEQLARHDERTRNVGHSVNAVQGRISDLEGSMQTVLQHQAAIAQKVGVPVL